MNTYKKYFNQERVNLTLCNICVWERGFFMDIIDLKSALNNHISTGDLKLLFEEKVFKRSREQIFLEYMQSSAEVNTADKKHQVKELSIAIELIKDLLNSETPDVNLIDDLIEKLNDLSIFDVQSLFSRISYVCYVNGRLYNTFLFQKEFLLRFRNKKKCLPIWKIWADLFGEMHNVEKFAANTNSSKYNYFRKLLFNGSDVGGLNLKKEEDFYGLIKGKGVAIIGPASNISEDTWSRIREQWDVIIVITYKDDTVYPIGNTSNTKISYYNNESKREIENNQSDFIKRLDYVCFKSNPSKKIDAVRYRRFLSLDGLYYYGIPHMLPNILFDIIRFRPNEIGVFGFNLYLSNQQYREKYQSRKKNASQWLKDFAIHDIAIQYNVLEIFYRNNYFQPDDQLKSVLEMGIYNYLRAMESIYSI